MVRAFLRRLGALAALVLLAAASGCVTGVVPMDQGVLARLKEEPAIHVVQYRPAVINVRTRIGDAVTQLNPYAGVLPTTSGSPGHSMMREYALADPAVRVQERFLATLGSQLRLENLRVAPSALDSDEPEALRGRLPGGLVLDFRTLAWVVRFDPNRLFSYFVAYYGRGRLIRLDTSQVIWQATCETPFPAQAEPTLSQLTAGGGALLKGKSSAEADRCAAQLLDQFFGRKLSGS